MTEKSEGGAHTNAADPAPTSVGGAGSEGPIVSFDEAPYEIVEWRQTNLEEYFGQYIDTMDKAVKLGLMLKDVGERCEIAIGKLANHVERGKWGGGITAFAKRIDIPVSTVHEWSQATATPELSERSETLGVSKVALVERAPDPEVLWEWIDEQEQPPTAKEIRAKAKRQKREEQVLITPEGEFDIIVADPPWPLEGIEYDPTVNRRLKDLRRVHRPYDRMTIEEIADLDIPATDDCILWLWTTNIQLLNGNVLHVLDVWGFEPKSLLTWVKNSYGTGYWLRGKTEHCILATKGKPVWTNTTETTMLEGKAREDSRKPDEFYDMVERICVGKKLDMFSREKREGWEQWGDEVDKFQEGVT